VVLVENVLSNSVERWPTVLGLVFILVILFARAGIVGSLLKLFRRIRRRGTAAPPGTQDAHDATATRDSNHTAGKEMP